MIVPIVNFVGRDAEESTIVNRNHTGRMASLRRARIKSSMSYRSERNLRTLTVYSAIP